MKNIQNLYPTTNTKRKNLQKPQCMNNFKNLNNNSALKELLELILLMYFIEIVTITIIIIICPLEIYIISPNNNLLKQMT